MCRCQGGSRAGAPFWSGWVMLRRCLLWDWLPHSWGSDPHSCCPGSPPQPMCPAEEKSFASLAIGGKVGPGVGPWRGRPALVLCCSLPLWPTVRSPGETHPFLGLPVTSPLSHNWGLGHSCHHCTDQQAEAQRRAGSALLRKQVEKPVLPQKSCLCLYRGGQSWAPLQGLNLWN